MPGTLGSDHDDINIGRRNDGFEMNAEAVREAENFTRMQIGLDVLVVKFGLGLVGRENVDPVGALGGLIGGDDDHAVGLGLLRALAVGIEADDDFVSAVAEILGLGVSLAAVAEDGDGFALQCLGLGVAFVKNSDHCCAPLVAQGRKGTLAFWGWEPVSRTQGRKAIPRKTDRSVGMQKCYAGRA